MFNSKYKDNKNPGNNYKFGNNLELFDVDESKVSEPYFIDFLTASTELN
jgi:hypothetical protein